MAGHDLESTARASCRWRSSCRSASQPDYFRGDVQAALCSRCSATRPARTAGAGSSTPTTSPSASRSTSAPSTPRRRRSPGSLRSRSTTFHRQACAGRPPGARRTASCSLGRLEIARLDNDPNFPERGVLRLIARRASDERATAAPTGLDDCGCCEASRGRDAGRGRQPAGPAGDRLPRRHPRAEFKQSHAGRGSRCATLPALRGPRRPARTTTSPSRCSTPGRLVADVLTFYQERIANESYLRTATERALAAGPGPAHRLRARARAWRRRTYLAFTLEEAPGAPRTAHRCRRARRCRASRRRRAAADVRDRSRRSRPASAWNAAPGSDPGRASSSARDRPRTCRG